MLTFRTLDARRATEPTDWVELHGAKIHISTRPDAIAHYVSGHWIYDGARCSYIECRVMLTLHFEDSARGACSIAGPYLGIRIRDRYLFGGRAQVATLSPDTGHWLHYRTTESWPVVRVLADRPQGQ
jgi:hypothetical protein